MGNRATTRTMLLTAVGALILAGCSHEAADWKSATLANTTEAYQSFLQQYPHSREAADAQARIKQLTEERDWQSAVAANTRDAYQQFTTQHPDSKYADEAKMRIENFAQADLGAAPTGGAGMSAAAGASPSVAPPAAMPPASAAGEVASVPAQSAAEPQAKSKTKAKAKAALAAAKHASHTSHGNSAHALARSQWVQLGAFGTKSRAQLRWRQLAARFTALKTLHPRYVAVRSRQHHVYRLEVRVSSAAAASGLCATLKRHAQACMRVNA